MYFTQLESRRHFYVQTRSHSKHITLASRENAFKIGKKYCKIYKITDISIATTCNKNGHNKNC